MQLDTLKLLQQQQFGQINLRQFGFYEGFMPGPYGVNSIIKISLIEVDGRPIGCQRQVIMPALFMQRIRLVD